MQSSSLLGKSVRYNRAKLLGSFKFGCDSQINELVGNIFSEREHHGAILAVSARNSRHPDFCIISSSEMEEVVRVATLEARKSSVIIELRD